MVATPVPVFLRFRRSDGSVAVVEWQQREPLFTRLAHAPGSLPGEAPYAPDVLASHFLGRAEVFAEPFPYLLSAPFVPGADYAGIVEWIRSFSDWTPRSGPFYQYHDARPLQHDPPAAFRALITPPVTDLLAERLRHYFKVPIGRLNTVVLIRYMDGDGVGLHNDFDEADDESHRIVVHFHAREQGRGGELVLFRTRDESDIATIITPITNRAMAFCISETSYHGVADVTDGERFTLSYSFITERSGTSRD